MTKPWCVLTSWGLGSSGLHVLPLPSRPLGAPLVYLATNLLVDKNVEDAVVILDRAAKAG